MSSQMWRISSIRWKTPLQMVCTVFCKVFIRSSHDRFPLFPRKLPVHYVPRYTVRISTPCQVPFPFLARCTKNSRKEWSGGKSASCMLVNKACRGWLAERRMLYYHRSICFRFADACLRTVCFALICYFPKCALGRLSVFLSYRQETRQRWIVVFVSWGESQPCNQLQRALTLAPSK